MILYISCNDRLGISMVELLYSNPILKYDSLYIVINP